MHSQVLEVGTVSMLTSVTYCTATVLYNGSDNGGQYVRELVLTAIASFPGRSRLQFLIAYCVQKRRGKAWEKESRA